MAGSCIHLDLDDNVTKIFIIYENLYRVYMKIFLILLCGYIIHQAGPLPRSGLSKVGCLLAK